MEAEVTTEIVEQSKAVVATTKVKLTATEGEAISESFIKELSLQSIKAAINNFEQTRGYCEAKTIRK